MTFLYGGSIYRFMSVLRSGKITNSMLKSGLRHIFL